MTTDFSFGHNSEEDQEEDVIPAADPGLERLVTSIRAMVRDITNEVKENKMALPAPTAKEGGQDRSPKLEVRHVKSGATITLTGEGREVSSDFGDSLVLDVLLGSKAFAWFVRLDSKNYRDLYAKFGKNLAKWRGKVRVIQDEYLGNKYIKVVDGDNSGKSTKKRK